MCAYETGRKSLSNPADIYLFKVNNGDTRTMCEIYPKFRGIFKIFYINYFCKGATS